MNKYSNYFKNHFRISISEYDIQTYRQWFQAQWNFFSSKISVNKKTKVLEIGSGVGGFYSFLQSVIDSTNYTGLELDNHACEFANKHFQVNRFKNLSIESFSPNTKFNTIFAFEVLEHIDDPNAIINKTYKLLERNGVFVGTTPFPYKKNVYADETHRYLLHPSNWKKLFIDNGFSSVETYPMSFIPFLWRLHRIFNVKIPFYIPFPNFISTTLIIARK